MILDELRKVASGLQGRCAPVPWGIDGMGDLGHMTRERGLYINPTVERPLRTALREHARYEAVSRHVSRGMFGANDLVPIARSISDSCDVVRTIKRMQGAITSYAGIVAAQAGGKSADCPFQFGAFGTASVWHAPFSGFSPTNIPGGSQFTGSTLSSTNQTLSVVNPAFANIGASDHCYLTQVSGGNAVTFGQSNHIIGVVDVLVGAGNIAAATATSQNISTTALPRWTSGEGLCMTLTVTTALVGGTAPTIAITYTDQAGNTANSTGAITLTTGAAAGRLLPVQDGPMIRLASPDYGVRQIEACIITGTITSGVMAAYIYKPILFMGILSTFVTERTTPAQAGSFRRITDSVGALPFISVIRYTTGTSGNALHGFMSVVWG